MQQRLLQIVIKTGQWGILTLLTGFCSCQMQEAAAPEKKAVARVYDRFLYEDEVMALVPEGMSSEDSMARVNEFVTTWIERQLLLHVAERNLPERMEEIDRQANEYKESLMIDAYLSEYVGQRLDTAIGPTERQQYFEANRAQFVLRDDVYRVEYTVIEEGEQVLDSLIYWFERSDRYTEQAFAFCDEYCVDFRLEGGTWYSLEDLRRALPGLAIEPDEVSMNRTVQAQGEGRIFLLRFWEQRRQGEIGPIAYFEYDLERRLIDIRRREMVRQTYRELYIDGGKRKDFEIYE